MSRTPRAAILGLLFLAPLLAGCQGRVEPTTTTTTTTPEPGPAGFLEIEGPSDFYVSSFIPLSTEGSERSERMVAYGASKLANQIPYVGVYDAAGGWTSVQVSKLPSAISHAYGAVASDGTILLAMELDTEPQGMEPFTNVATFDGATWTVEDAPTRWLRYETHGVTSIADRTYVLVGEHSVGGGTQALWHTDDHGATWLLDPPLPTARGPAWLTGNATHLHICAQDEQANVVLLSRRPADLTYSVEVAWRSPAPVIIGGLYCFLSGPANGPPVLAWHEVPLSLQGGHPLNEVSAAVKVQGSWQAQQVGEEAGRVMDVLNATNGAFLHTLGNAHGEALWRFADGSWSLCPAGLETRVTATPKTLVKWNGQPMMASIDPYPVYNGTVILQPLDPTTPDCLAHA